MKKLLITFSGARYDRTTQRIVEDAPKLGADQVLVYDDVWLRATEFYAHNRWLWEHHGGSRGFGWFCWKPFIILDAMTRCEPGDVVAFVDADTRPVSDFSIIYDIADRDGAMFFTAHTHSNHRWCKADCYVVMAQHPQKYMFVQAGCARFMAFKNGPWKPRQFLMEWLTYCVNPLATTYDKSVLGPEHPEFQEHRNEQAIMTLLAHKYGYKLHRECDDSGEPHPEDRDLYPQLFEQTRQGDASDPSGSRFRNV